MENLDIRLFVDDNKLMYKDIARVMGITPYWLSHLLKSELSRKNRNRILAAASYLIKEKKNEKCKKDL